MLCVGSSYLFSMLMCVYLCVLSSQSTVNNHSFPFELSMCMLNLGIHPGPSREQHTHKHTIPSGYFHLHKCNSFVSGGDTGDSSSGHIPLRKDMAPPLPRRPVPPHQSSPPQVGHDSPSLKLCLSACSPWPLFHDVSSHSTSGGGSQLSPQEVSWPFDSDHPATPAADVTGTTLIVTVV